MHSVSESRAPRRSCSRATPSDPQGAVFCMMLPTEEKSLEKLEASGAWLVGRVEPLRNPSPAARYGHHLDGYRGVYHRARIRATRWLYPPYGYLIGPKFFCPKR